MRTLGCEPMKYSLVALTALITLAGCTSSPVQNDEPTPSSLPDEPAMEKTADSEILSGKHTVVLKTSLGDITMELDADAAPKTVTNFVTLTKEGYYTDHIFHRVMDDFMIQGGDPTGTGMGGKSIYGDVFEDEINANSYGLDKKKLVDIADGVPPNMAEMTVKEYYESAIGGGYKYDSSLESLPMDRGYVAMANRGPATNGSQFFIIQKQDGTSWLDGKHTVFGKVTSGMDVVDNIAKQPVDPRANKPLEDITFTAEVVE